MGTGNAGPTATAVLLAGGTGGTDKTEVWNGTAWSEDATMGTGRTALKGAGTSVLAVVMSGQPAMTNTEEYSFATAVETIAFD